MAYYVCVLDFEATCWADTRNDEIREIIEFPSVLYKVDFKNKIKFISEFQKYVKPQLNPILSDFCTELTGITQETVDTADIFSIVYEQHYKWIQSNVPENSKLIFVTCGEWDLRDMLPIEVKRYNLVLHYCYTKYVDLKTEFGRCFETKVGGMVNMLKKANIELTGKHHSGIDDCRNMAKIVIKMIENKHKFNRYS